VSSARAQSAVVGELAALGPFFAVEAHPPGAPPGAPWRPLAEVLTSPVLQQRIGMVRSALRERASRDGDDGSGGSDGSGGGVGEDGSRGGGVRGEGSRGGGGEGEAGRVPGDVELRVAASVTQLGMVARLIAPALAAQAAGHQLALPLAGVWWQDVVGGPVPLSVPAPPAGLAASAGQSASAPPSAGATQAPSAGHPPDPLVTLLEEVITPITAVTAGLAPVSPRVLWGNVASAINGAASQVARARPDLATNAWATAAAVFQYPRLSTEPGPPGPSFRRSSCCLIYRLAPASRGGAYCGDCVLRDRR